MNSTTPPSLHWTDLAPTELAGTGPIAAEWDRLNSARLDLPFLSAAAMAAALSAFGQGRERLLVGRQQGRAVAMFLVAPAGRWRWATFQPSQLPLGAWVAESGWSLEALTRSLLRGPLGTCLVLSITQVDPLAEPRGEQQPAHHYGDYIDTAWVDIEGSFADYWAARGKNLRQNLRKQRNKLAAEGVQTQMRVFTAAEDMAPALARYGAMESAGWKAGEGTSIDAGNVQGRFYTSLFVEAAGRGEARVYEYLFDDRSVAMNLCLLRGGVLYVLKTTYDESIKLFSPASLLREDELQSFFAGGEVRRIEYYGRLMDWHSKLTDRKRSLHHLTVYRWAVLKKVAERRWAAAARAAAELPPSPEPTPAVATASPAGGTSP